MEAAYTEEGAKIRNLAAASASEEQRLKQLNREELKRHYQLQMSHMSEKSKLEQCNRIKEEVSWNMYLFRNLNIDNVFIKSIIR